MSPQHQRFDDRNNTPWYIIALYKYGVPSAIALFLVYRMTTGLPHQEDVAEVKTLLNTHVVATEAQLVEIRLLLRAICYNTSKDESQGRGCMAASAKYEH